MTNDAIALRGGALPAENRTATILERRVSISREEFVEQFKRHPGITWLEARPSRPPTGGEHVEAWAEDNDICLRGFSTDCTAYPLVRITMGEQARRLGVHARFDGVEPAGKRRRRKGGETAFAVAFSVYAVYSLGAVAVTVGVASLLTIGALSLAYRVWARRHAWAAHLRARGRLVEAVASLVHPHEVGELADRYRELPPTRP